MVVTAAGWAQANSAPKQDERYKADILVIVAHPDDETMVTSYLAQAIFDEHKRVAVIFGTRGNGGGDAAGPAQAAALGAEREIEARRALNVLGVTNVWFLNGPDTPGQDVLRSLETWNHGASLDQTIRLVRLTRPEVILTWLPVYVAGENHGDHQAAGVLATEAFDMAGDPAAFGEQISYPREANGIGNLTEGLEPWQAKKLYYFSDAAHTEFLEGKGPKISTETESPSKKVPYYKIAAEEMTYHLTQGDTGQLAVDAIKKGDYTYFKQPQMLVLGKSHVQGSVTGDVLEGIQDKPIAFAPPVRQQAAARSGVSLELGGPWSYYKEFWLAHDLKPLHTLLPDLEVAMGAGEQIHVPILLHNDTDSSVDVSLDATLPAGWSELQGKGLYAVPAHSSFPVYVTAKASTPATGKVAHKLEFTAMAGGKTLEPIRLNVYLAAGTLPQ